jgi:hypothetical protein
MTFSKWAITSKMMFLRVNSMHCWKDDVILQTLSCKTYALTPYGLKVLIWAAGTLQYQR